MTFERCKELFSTARYPERGKPLANNTRLFDRGTHFAIRLHETDVVEVYPDDTQKLFTGGWQTYTTKDRINGWSSARIYQSNGIWYMNDGSLFYEGIAVAPGGIVVDPVSDKEVKETERLKRKLDRMVAKYVKGFLKHIADNGGLEAPSGGDCWGCCMTGGDRPAGEPRGLAMGIDHILLHFEEKYYVPALLHNAFMENGRNPSYFWPRKGENGLGSEFWTGHALRYYLGKLKPQLLEALRERESLEVAA